MKFCNDCNILLTSITTSDNFYYVCNMCNIKYEIENDDSLVYSEDKKINFAIYKTLIKHAAEDPINQKVELECKKCKYNVVKQIRLSENDLRIVNTCLQCNEQWLN